MARAFRSLGFYAIAWIEHFLVHGPGDVQGKRIELDDELAEFTLKGYELNGRGNRKVRRAFLSRPKGRNKSGYAAMIECFEALGECRFDHWASPGEVSDWGYRFEPGEPVGKQLTYVEVLNVATEESQAGNTYDAVYYMLHPDTCSPEFFERFGALDVGLTRVNLPNFRGSIEPVTASNDSKDGAKSTFIVADETHLWVPPTSGAFKLGKMHQTMVRNLLKRKEASGWMLETSTMYAKGDGSVAEGTHAYAQSLTAGHKDGRLLFDHRQAADTWDLSKRGERIKALREAYGPAAGWMNLAAIADYWDDPQASEAEFRRFFLNQPVSLKGFPPAFDLVRWVQLEDATVGQPSRAAMVIHVSDDGDAAVLGVAGDVGGRTLVLCYCGQGTGWVAAKAAEVTANRDVAEVALTPGEARALLPALVRQGIKFAGSDAVGRKLSGPDMDASYSAFRRAISDDAPEGSPAVVHVGQSELDLAVAHARVRDSGEPDGWEPALVAVAAAYYRWGLQDAPVPAIY